MLRRDMDPAPLPRLHFSPRAGRVGEIYGVTREDGRYRLYYSIAGGGGLGQAVSDDLVIWWEQPVAAFDPGGAGSVVTRDLPPDVVAVGSPARVIRAVEP